MYENFNMRVMLFSGGRDRLEPVGGGGGGLSLYICNHKEEGAERELAGGGRR